MSALKISKIKELIETESPVFLEIGANVGRDTRKFLSTFLHIDLYCFEPDQRCIRKFKKYINDDRCKLFEVALSDEIGEMEFYLSGGSRPGHTGQHINSSSLLKPTGHLKRFPWVTFEDKTTVATTTLDTWYENSGLRVIDFIWADIQGAEEKMICGGLKALSNARFFYTEFNHTELYEGQINLSGIEKLLPDFQIEVLYEHDVLFRNNKQLGKNSL